MSTRARNVACRYPPLFTVNEDVEMHDTNRLRPFVSAHRHGNDSDLMRSAVEAHADFVEVDVHLSWGRLEARHEKTVGPLPVLFDRGQRIQLRWRRLRFAEPIVDEAPAGTAFHIDLKGWSPRA